MRIYSIKATSINGKFVSKALASDGYSDWYAQSREAIASGVAIRMKWEGNLKRKVLDMIPSTLPELILSEKALCEMGAYLDNLLSLTVITDDGLALNGVKPKNFTNTSAAIDHLFVMYPKFSFKLVTEKFKDVWESAGLTGATFTEVDKLDSSQFRNI